jgi:O-antigen ligase
VAAVRGERLQSLHVGDADSAGRSEDGRGSWPATLALVALALLALLSPWPFGSVQPWAIRLLAACSLGAALVALLGGLGRGLVLTDAPLWPLLGFVLLGLFQLVPLPGPVLALVAPGAAAVWYPAEPSAAAVLGAGWRCASLDPETTARAVALVGGLGLLATLASSALVRPRRALAAAATVVAGGATLATYAIFARARFGALLYGRIPVPTVSPFGPFVSKNHFAGYAVLACLVGFGLALGLADRERERGARGEAPGVVAAVVAALALALAVLVSMSRGGVASLMAGIAALAVVRFKLRHRSGVRLLPLLVLSMVVAALLAAALPREAQVRMQTLDQASSFRLDTWRDVLRMCGASPVVGQGLGAFHDAFPRFKRAHGEIRVEHSENDYLETLAETGLVGLAFAVLALAGLLTAAGRGVAGGGHPLVRGLGTGAVAGLVALTVHSAFDFNLRIPSNAVLAAFVAALAAGASGRRPTPLPRPATAALALLAALLLALGLRSAPDRAPAARGEVAQAVTADRPEVRALRLARAEDALLRVLERRPAHAESWLLLAAVRAERGDPVGAAGLGRHAAQLDPQRKELQSAAGAR